MARASSKANYSVAQLGEAILTVGGTAKNLAGGTVELNTALGVLANRGIKGAEGGTALRNMILSLSAPTDKAAATLKSLGVSAFDAEGNLNPLNETFKKLDAAMQSMSQEQKTNVLNNIFNKVDLKVRRQCLRVVVWSLTIFLHPLRAAAVPCRIWQMCRWTTSRGR